MYPFFPIVSKKYLIIYGREQVTERLRYRLSALSVFEATVSGFKESLHFAGSARDCSLDVCRVVGDGEGMAIFRPGLEKTAFVPKAGLVAVFVAEMNLNASEMRFESVEDAVKIGFDQAGELCVHEYVLIAIDLNLHSFSFSYLPA
jgi:hypothetical protein